MKLTPTQQQACDELRIAAQLRIAPLVELRSPVQLGRGHGVTTVLRALSEELGIPLISLSTALNKACTNSEFPGLLENEPIRVIRAAAQESLAKHNVAIIDDLDLAICSRHVKRSRTMVGEVKGAGTTWSFDVATGPTLLLKSLADEVSTAGQVIIYAVLEDSFAPLMQAPFLVSMGEPTKQDYEQILKNRLGDEAVEKLDVGALVSWHSQLSPSELLNALTRAALKAARSAPQPLGGWKWVPDTESIVASVRETVIDKSAVRPEDVEAVDIDKFPGMSKIKDDLEKYVLFPLENPEKAAELGLQPKRGVMIHGKPGTGKTTVGRWLAHRLKGKFFMVGEMMLHSDIIRVFAEAKAAAPSVVFIDDADIVIGGWRPLDGHRGSDIFRFLLSQLDGLTSRGQQQQQNGDVIIMLTGQDVRWMADMLLRSGRIELWLKTRLPETKTKRDILKKYISSDPGAMQLLAENGEVPDVRPASSKGERYCCADLRRIVNDAKVLAAWDEKNNPDKKAKHTGAGYLEDAAEAVTTMQNEVDDLTRNIYT